MPILVVLFLLLGCASQSVKKEVACPANHIKGSGSGTTEQDALMQARAEISSQIHSSITAAYKSTNKQTNESLETKFKSDVRQTTELLNAQDVKLQASRKIGEKVEVVACMSREDAAKPYLSQLPRINDSLNLAIQTELAQSHPRVKKEAAQTAENLKMRQIIAAQILQGLGKHIELPSSSVYDEMIKDYKEYFSEFKFIWGGEDEEISQILLSKISSRYKIGTGSCVKGLKLIPIFVDIECGNSQYGPQCHYIPALEGRSCEEELYFTLRGQRVQGTGERDENDAKRKLLALISKAPFWDNWFEELDKYVAN
ncbi:MAG: hypothetical protein FWB90_04140 [Fibromonadales bacterium]|nr:hypothetical protein [Fibromonadales bacterium]